MFRMEIFVLIRKSTAVQNLISNWFQDFMIRFSITIFILKIDYSSNNVNLLSYTLNHKVLSSGIKYFSIISSWLHSTTNPQFLAHYLICINIFMCFQVLLLLYSLLTRSSRLIGCCNVFNGATFFFGLHGYSELLGRSAQPMGELRGLLLVRFCPWP